MEIQKNQRNKKLKKQELNLQTFQCKFLQKLQISKNKSSSSEDDDDDLDIGTAWSGINIRKDQKPTYFYGTENGFAVKISVQDKQQKNTEKQMQNKACKILDYEIKNSENGQQVFSNVLENQNLNIQIFKLYVSDYPCLQIGQFNNNYIALSTREEGQYQLYILNQDLEMIFQIENPLTSMQFVKYQKNVIIFRQKLNENSLLRIGQINDNKFEYYQRQILINDSISCFYVYQDVLFVGLLKFRVQVYSIKKRKLIKSLDVKAQFDIIRIHYNPKYQMISVVSKMDELFLIDYLSGNVIQSYSIKDILQNHLIDCPISYQIFLFSFVNPEIIVIGGSFQHLIFLEWQSRKIIKQYSDQSYFVGSFIHNNLLYLTHEKSSDITILY